MRALQGHGAPPPGTCGMGGQPVCTGKHLLVPTDRRRMVYAWKDFDVH